MGVNFYIKSLETGITLLHLGKSSGGWKFLFRATTGGDDFGKWKARVELFTKISSLRIITENEEEVSFGELLERIEYKQQDKSWDGLSRSFYTDKDGYCFSLTDFD